MSTFDLNSPQATALEALAAKLGPASLAAALLRTLTGHGLTPEQAAMFDAAVRPEVLQ